MLRNSLISDEDMDAEEEYSNENVNFVEDTVIEVQDTPGIDHLAVNSRKEQSQSGRAPDRNLNREWSSSSEHHTQIPIFLGSTLPDIDDISSPHKYFSLFFDDGILDQIVQQSNLYSLQQDINKPLNLTIAELEKWLGLLLYFSLSKLPNTRMHWAKEFAPLTDYAADCMSPDRFEAIKRNLHLADNTEQAASGENNYDPLYKVRPLINHLRTKFQNITKKQNLCIDQQMVPYKGKTRLKQYLPNKPKKWSCKLFVLSDVEGLMYDFIPYTGKIAPVEDPNIPDLKVCSNIVLHLAQNIPSDQNFLLFFDNSFTSIPLLQHLAERGIWCCGTVRMPRLAGLPKSVSDDKSIIRNGRGSHEELKLQHHNSEVILVRWYDNKIVNLVSTFAKANPVVTISRFDKTKKKVIEIPCPDIVQRYNKSMGGVDLAHHLLALYRINTKAKKCYHKLIYHFIDMAVVNAWLLYRRDAVTISLNKNEILSLASFKLHVAFTLTKRGKACQQFKHGRPSSRLSDTDAKRTCGYPSNEIHFAKVAHMPFFSDKRKKCKNTNCSGKTHIYCQECNINLCLNKHKNCFASFHGF